MTIACAEALDLFKRFAADEIAAYQAYLPRYRENEVKRERSKRKASVPMRAALDWKPDDLKGKNVLVIGEGGPGDEILTLGCVEDLRPFCKTVTWRCSEKLQPLLQASMPEVRFIADDAPDHGADVVIHAWQLIERFRPSLREFAWTTSGRFTPYLHPGKMGGDKNRKPRIGLAWHSDRGKPGKSCDIDTIPGWAAFFQTLGERAQFISLQMDAAQGAIDAVKGLYGTTIDQQPNLDIKDDLAGVAALVASLDYVVSISTTVVHVAGALGVPGWVLLPDEPLPHWDAGRHVCVWYPTLVPVRHTTPGDWDSAIAQVTRELLSELTNARPETTP